MLEAEALSLEPKYLPLSRCPWHRAVLIQSGHAELGVGPITSISQDNAAGNVVFHGLFHQIQGDFWFRFKGYIFRDTSFSPSRFVIGPFLRPIHAIADGKASVMIGCGNRNCVLTVILLAKLAAILPCDVNLVLSFILITCVIEYQCFNSTALLYCR